jgi:hypothetical protein
MKLGIRTSNPKTLKKKIEKIFKTRRIEILSCYEPLEGANALTQKKRKFIHVT